MTAEKEKEIPFDQALQRLEKLVQQLESGDLSLEDSMKAYEEGMKLNKLCADKLGQAEKKIEKLVRTADGSLQWKNTES
ncbi:MAG: exodeoxyribonuclease VII small subunit [Lentisphaeria bacterium]